MGIEPDCTGHIPEYVAVYGSLMRGQGIQRSIGVVDKLRPAGPCRIRGDLFTVAEYPGLVDGDGNVLGELYEVLDPTAWMALDSYEEYDPAQPGESLFIRRQVPLLSPEVIAWVYFYNRPVTGLQRINQWPGC